MKVKNNQVVVTYPKLATFTHCMPDLALAPSHISLLNYTTDLAIQVTTDADHKFELALQLDDLDTALEIARSSPELEGEVKWKALGDCVLAVWHFDLASGRLECADATADGDGRLEGARRARHESW